MEQVTFIAIAALAAITIIAVRIIIGIRKFNGYAKKRRSNLAPDDVEKDAAKPGGRE